MTQHQPSEMETETEQLHLKMLEKSHFKPPPGIISFILFPKKKKTTQELGWWEG